MPVSAIIIPYSLMVYDSFNTFRENIFGYMLL